MNRILTQTRLLTAALLFGALPLLPLAPDLCAQSTSSAAKEIHVALTADKIAVEAAYVVPKKDIAELKKLLSALTPKARDLSSARKQWSTAAQNAKKREKDPPPTDAVDKALTAFEAASQKVVEFIGKGSYATIEVTGGTPVAKPKEADPAAAKEANAGTGKEAAGAGKKAKSGTASKETAAEKKSAEASKASDENTAPQDSYLYYTWSKSEEKKSGLRTETTKTEGIAVVKVAQKLTLRGTGEAAVSWFVESEVTEAEKPKKDPPTKGNNRNTGTGTGRNRK